MHSLDPQSIVKNLANIPLGGFQLSEGIGEATVRSNRFPAVPRQPYALLDDEIALSKRMAQTVDLVMLYHLPENFHRIIPARGYPFTVDEITDVRKIAARSSWVDAEEEILQVMNQRTPGQIVTWNFYAKLAGYYKIVPTGFAEPSPVEITFGLREPADCLRAEGVAFLGNKPVGVPDPDFPGRPSRVS